MALSRQKGLELDAAEFTNNWRRGLFRVLGKVRKGELPFMNVDKMHRLVLDQLLEQRAITTLSEQEKQLYRELRRIETFNPRKDLPV